MSSRPFSLQARAGRLSIPENTEPPGSN
jgi:hypothetical protein